MKHLMTSLLVLLLLSSIDAQTKNKKLYMFGHSLMDHRPPALPTTPDETTIPHWMHLFAEEANHTFAAAGQYGFLRSHANLPPQAQWGYQLVDGAWDQDNETYPEANMYDVFITAGNFIQYLPPEDPYEDPENTAMVSPLSATVTILDWLDMQEDDSLNVFIYENWPEMGATNTGTGPWPISEAEYDTYNAFLRGAFHDWWLDYYNSLRSSRPDVNLKLIPVGPIIADLTDGLLSAIPVTDLYEDSDPHGQPNIYFLAGLISYMAVYEEKAPVPFTIPNSIHPAIRDNYSDVVDFIWDELVAFTDSEGNNIVFPNASVDPPQSSENVVRVEDAALYIEDEAGIILKGQDGNCYNVYIDASGVLQNTLIECPN